MRRTAIALGIALAGWAGTAAAQDSVKIVVPFAAGGPVDAMARLLAQEMQGPLGVNIVVENRAGGGGVIAADMVSRAPADGKTLLMGSQGAHVITAVLQPHVKYDPVKSFDPIAMVGASPTLLVANPQLPFKDFKDFVALAKSRNLSRLDVVPADAPVLLPLVVANQVRPVVVLGVKRLAALPDVPSTVELGYTEMVMENWYGLVAPAGLAPDVAKKLEAAALTAIKSAAIQAHMKKGEISGTLNAKEFGARIASDVARWRPTLPKLGIVAQDGPAPAAPAAATPAVR
jgi:tripartite-type tricarboxylate transporter receptor subunit TctC